MESATARPADDLVAFRARVEHWLPQARVLVDALYGAVTDADELCARLVGEAEQAARARKPALRALDVRRQVDPLWFQRETMVGYVAYADRFGGTLRGVAEHLDHLDELSVTYLHLMKVMRSREGANDGGYAVVDYGDVDPALGTRADLEALADQLREHGISLCLDVVMNHTAREHTWAVQARAGSARHRDYYLVFPDRTMPDRYEATLPEVFPEMAPGSFTWDEELAAWVWTTFHHYQWDLDYANPEVFVEMLRVMLDLANLGVEMLRLDAVAFTWKRMGTNCQNQPEAHLIAQLFRAVLAMAAPAAVLKAEAIVAPTDLVPYLGMHRTQRAECQIAYHNQLMVMLWSALATGDVRLATASLESLPPTPVDAGWVTYLRCHDDIGWAVDDALARSVSISGPLHRRHLAAFYRGDAPLSFARGAAFSSNPDADDERTCGTAASLCGVEHALDVHDAVALDLAVRRLLLGYAVVFAFGGIPLIYMGDEIAMLNDLSYLDDPALADDSRWMHRPHMDWAGVNTPTPVGERVLAGMRHFARTRAATPALAGGGSTYMHRLTQPSVLAWERRQPRHGRFYGLANVSTAAVSLPVEVLSWAGLEQPVELLHLDATHDEHGVHLGPMSVAWFIDGADGALQPALPGVTASTGTRTGTSTRPGTVPA